MIEAWKDLLGSKKFWTAILAVLTLLGAKKGLDVDQQTFWAIAGIYISLLGAQGLTDHGKERGQDLPPARTVSDRTATDPATPAPPAAPPLAVVPPPPQPPTP